MRVWEERDKKIISPGGAGGGGGVSSVVGAFAERERMRQEY